MGKAKERVDELEGAGNWLVCDEKLSFVLLPKSCYIDVWLESCVLLCVVISCVCVCVCCRALPHDLSYSQCFPLLLNEACISKMTLFLSPCSFIKSRNTILKCFQKNL